MDPKKFILVCLSVLLLTLGITHFVDRTNASRLKIGDVYTQTLFKGDPFREDIFIDYRVINLKDDYVQYINIKNNDTSSMEKTVFVRWYEKKSK